MNHHTGLVNMLATTNPQTARKRSSVGQETKTGGSGGSLRM